MHLIPSDLQSMGAEPFDGSFQGYEVAWYQLLCIWPGLCGDISEEHEKVHPDDPVFPYW